MPRVSAGEGISYGVSLFGYMLGVTVFGFLFFVLGAALIFEGPVGLGIVLLLVGVVASYAGMAGTLYKVIADGVAKGMDTQSATSTAKKIYSDQESTSHD